MKNVIITGAKGNLGVASVQTFLNKNYHVIACISNRDSRFDFENTNLEVVPLDLLDNKTCDNFVDTQAKKHGTIDAAILTVGGFIIGNMEKVRKDDFDKMIALNFYTAFNMVQPLYRKMVNQALGGKIILIGSEPGESGEKAKGSVAYGLSKSLIFRLAELVNAEGKSKNVTAYVVIPTTIDTPQNRAAMPNADFSKWLKPETIAERMERVCSSEDNDKIIRFH